MIKEVYEEVVSIMETLTGDGQPFVAVYGYKNPAMDVFPIAIVDLSGGATQDHFSSNVKNLNGEIVIACLFRQKQTEASNIQRMEALEAVINKFTEEGIANYLNDTTEKMDLSYELFVTDSAEQPIFGFYVTLSFMNPMNVA